MKRRHHQGMNTCTDGPRQSTSLFALNSEGLARHERFYLPRAAVANAYAGDGGHIGITNGVSRCAVERYYVEESFASA